jgi:hypothetical protein
VVAGIPLAAVGAAAYFTVFSLAILLSLDITLLERF